MKPGLRRGVLAGLLLWVGAGVTVSGFMLDGLLLSLAVTVAGLSLMAWAMLLLEGD